MPRRHWVAVVAVVGVVVPVLLMAACSKTSSGLTQGA
jgi:hypothetical protein